MRNVAALALVLCSAVGVQAAPLLALAKAPRRERTKPTFQAPKGAAAVLPAEDPYNMFHMMAQPEPSKPPPLPKRLPAPRPVPALRK